MKDTVPSALERNKAVSDTLPMLDEVLDLAPQLETRWAAERATLPPGTLVNDGDTGDGNEGDADADPDAGGGDGDEFLSSFDLETVDPAARPAVEALQKDWQGNYTKRRQADREEITGVRREAEQSAALIEGLRDPSTMPHYLRLMGIDLSDASTLEALGISGAGRGGGEVDDELRKLLEEDEGGDGELETRLAKLEGERQTEKQESQAAEVEQALDDLADQELEKIEGSWGRELDDDEDAFLRHRAEATPGPDGLPDYESAAATLKGWLTRRVQAELELREKPGRGAPGGKPGGKALDITKDEDRLQAGTAAAERAMASQQ